MFTLLANGIHLKKTVYFIDGMINEDEEPEIFP